MNFDPPLSALPNPRSDIVGWNKAWEESIDSMYVEDPTFHEELVQMQFQVPVNDENLIRHRGSILDLWGLQKRVTHETLVALREHNFDHQWLQADAAVRWTHLLEGLVRTCIVSAAMEGLRADAYELTLPRLQEREGRAFLDLLRSAMLRDIFTVPELPILLPNKRWSLFVGDGGRQ